MSYLNWHVGMKVVCVDDSESGSILEKYRLLQKDAIYTIKKISVASGQYQGRMHQNAPVVDLEEVSNRGLFGSTHFAAERFRPIQTKKTDISVFTALLTDTKHSVDA